MFAPFERKRPGAARAPGLASNHRLGGLLFGAQFAYLTHAPEGVFTLFLRKQSQIADGISGPANDLEFLARWRSALEDSRLAMEQFSQVVTSECFVDFIHVSHLFPFSGFDTYDLLVIHVRFAPPGPSTSTAAADLSRNQK